MIGIIDYGMGNLRSVQKALQFVGANARIITAPEQTLPDKLVLPGVGAFADGMIHLRRHGWIPYLQQFLDTQRPLLGICLGMQLLFQGSEEDASPGQLVPGLAILPGTVVRFQENSCPPKRLKVPHMGWNTLNWSRPDPLLQGLAPGDAMYFVHSYFVKPEEHADQPLTSATCSYGRPFTATVWRNNIWATQFHPEKSQRLGLRILKNFSTL